MTPQDDAIRSLPTPDNDAIPVPASVTDASRAHTHQDTSAPHRDITAWPANDNERVPISRSDALPTLPRSPSRLQRRWHLTPGETVPVRTQDQLAQPQPSNAASQWQRSQPAMHPAPQAAQTDSLNVAAQMLAQESPITEQGPPHEQR